MNRRHFQKLAGAALAAPALTNAQKPGFQFRYVLSSALYGDLPLADVAAEVNRAGCESLDIWRKVHATHREQITEMGDEAFQKILTQHQTRMSISTCYPLGAWGRDDEMAWVRDNGGSMTVCGTGRVSQRIPEGPEAREDIQKFFEQLKPHLEIAQDLGVMMAFENHSNSTLHHPDSMRYFAELNPDPQHVGIAFAPHHLQSFGDEAVAPMIRELGREQIPFIYFQEYGIGSKETVEKEVELEQLPGRGTLDYVPIVAALKEIQFDGLVEIFMHPTPRGIPMLPTAPEITDEINRSRAYIDDCLKEVE